MCVIVTYAINDKKSFDDVEVWKQDAFELLGEQIVYCLIGTKSDLKDEWIINEEEGIKKMEELGFDLFFETSSKLDLNIQDMFR